MSINERDRGLLMRISEHCSRIEDAKSRFGNTVESYIADADYRDVVCMNIFQIGELSNQLSDDFREEFSDISWHQMYGIRNILAHAYIKIDNETVWRTVQNDIPGLKSRIDEVLNR